MSFVRVEGTRFAVEGAPFRIAGANNYYLSFESDAMVTAVFDLAVQMGLNTLRTGAYFDVGATPPAGGVYFQYFDPAAGQPAFNDGPNGLERLDRTINMAEQRGIRLILPLVNYWPDFGGVDQYLHWFGLKARDRFFTHARVKAAYRNYVEHLLLRVNTRTGRAYRDEPAIMAWELANEPRGIAGIDAVAAWADEMSSFIRGIDTNHLICVGDEGLDNNYERLLDLPAVDFGTCHLYPGYSPAEDPVAFGVRWIQQHLQAAGRAGKPLIVEEFGVKIDSGSTARHQAYTAWLNQVVVGGGAGALVWMIASVMANGQLYPDYDHYTLYSAEDAPAIREFARSKLY